MYREVEVQCRCFLTFGTAEWWDKRAPELGTERASSPLEIDHRFVGRSFTVLLDPHCGYTEEVPKVR
jgi:hypothetical protein